MLTRLALKRGMWEADSFILFLWCRKQGYYEIAEGEMDSHMKENHQSLCWKCASSLSAPS
jgi:hypothetical protein